MLLYGRWIVMRYELNLGKFEIILGVHMKDMAFVGYIF